MDPLRTTGTPQILASAGTSNHITATDLGVVRRAGGTDQVTYKGSPLYRYSREQWMTSSLSVLPSFTGTVGNGNGLPGPGGRSFSVIPLG